MLLDRKRIRKWAKWVALGLAIVFAVSFLFLGVGYGGAGFDLSQIFQGCTETTVPQATDTVLEGLLGKLALNPDDTDVMQQIAKHYQRLYDPTTGTGAENLAKAAEYLERALSADPSLKVVYLDLAKLYILSASYKDAARVLNEATSVDPANPDVYYYLGRVQRALGDNGAAILAWQKYLQLAPNSRLSATVRTELEKLMAPSTTTTALTTTTTGGATTTTASSVTTSTTD